jgi:DNA-binding NtrC family response regulator
VAAEAMNKGAYHFLQKPFRMNELFGLIEKALEKNGQKGLEVLLEATMDRLNELFYADEGSLMLTDKAKRLYIACGRGLSE